MERWSHSTARLSGTRRPLRERCGGSVRRQPERGATRAPAEAMILEDLGQVDGWGYRHGLRYPRERDAHFGAAAGPVGNKDELKQFFEIIIDSLKRLYDIKFD